LINIFTLLNNIAEGRRKKEEGRMPFGFGSSERSVAPSRNPSIKELNYKPAYIAVDS
jgi:hypothetical protein